MAELSPAEIVLDRVPQGVWLDADDRKLVLAEIALLRRELREASGTAERLQAEAETLREAARVAERDAQLWQSRAMKDSPALAADSEIPPSHEGACAGDVLSAEEDASADAWLARIKDAEEEQFAAWLFDLPPPETKLLPAAPQAQAPSGEAPRAETSAEAQDAPTPHPARCNARNKRGGALCTRPAKKHGRCGRHPLREGEGAGDLIEPQGMGPAATEE